jgi:hypothetical protein
MRFTPKTASTSDLVAQSGPLELLTDWLQIGVTMTSSSGSINLLEQLREILCSFLLVYYNGVLRI